MATEPNTPVVWLSDGPRLILADGSVVRPLISDDEGDLPMVATDQGAAVYEHKGLDDEVYVRFVDDPEARDHGLVQEVLDEYDV